MIVLEVEKVEIDHCLACGGVWLDAGEMELLLEEASNRDELMATLSALVHKRQRKIRCPICSRRLHTVHYGPDRSLVLDKCPRHHGLWFDRDELCRALRMGRFEKGRRPIYEILNGVFGGPCEDDSTGRPREGQASATEPTRSKKGGQE